MRTFDRNLVLAAALVAVAFVWNVELHEPGAAMSTLVLAYLVAKPQIVVTVHKEQIMQDNSDLTNDQLNALVALRKYTNAPTARQLADRLDRPLPGAPIWQRPRAYGILRRLERRGLAERLPRRSPRRLRRWAITAAGRAELAARHV